MNTILRGDLLRFALEGRFDVIVPGCNCRCTMGAGIAKQIKAQFPEAYEADLRTAKGAKEKLGTTSEATVARGAASFVIVNGYTQYHWRGQGIKADYEAIRSVMQKVRNSFPGKRIGYPQIGAGLAGGDWSLISEIIQEELEGEDHALVLYEPHPSTPADGTVSASPPRALGKRRAG